MNYTYNLFNMNSTVLYETPAGTDVPGEPTEQPMTSKNMPPDISQKIMVNIGFDLLKVFLNNIV